MSTTQRNAPVGAENTAGAKNNTTTNQMRSSSMSTIDQGALPDQKSSCTGDVWCGCTCHACTVTSEHCHVAPLTVDGLLTEAEELLPTLLASRLASASQCFPGPDGARIYVSSDGPQICIAVTERDPETRQYVTREFAAEVREVGA
jgi:hypothetical protein